MSHKTQIIIATAIIASCLAVVMATCPGCDITLLHVDRADVQVALDNVKAIEMTQGEQK